MNIPSIENCDLHNKTVLLRVDFNVPIKDGEIRDVTRILRALPTVLVNAVFSECECKDYYYIAFRTPKG